MAKWSCKVEEQNGVLFEQNLQWKKMNQALEGYRNVSIFNS
jgi:hypothetical protein